MILRPDDLSLVPLELRERDQWLVWELVSRNGSKPTKRPVGSTTDPRTWSSFDAAMTAWGGRENGGVGFVFAGDDPYVGIDLDHCLDPATGDVTESWAQDILDELEGIAYVEQSPSGTGLHLIVRGDLPVKGKRKGPVEVYASARYFTMTGRALSSSDIVIGVAPDESLLRILHEYCGYTHRAQRAQRRSSRRVAVHRQPDVEACVRDLCHQSARFDALWSRRRELPSQSEYDLAIAGEAVRLGLGDDVIESLIVQHRTLHGQDPRKAERRDYMERTLDKARESASTCSSLTDTGNAERLADMFGRHVRYVARWKKYLVWQEGHWSVDSGQARLLGFSKDVARSLRTDAVAIQDPDAAKRVFAHATRSESRERRRAMVDLVRSEPGISISHDLLDRHEYLLNVSNGTLDLRTGKLRQHSPGDLITKIAPTAFDPEAACPHWDRFLTRTIPDAETRDFVQRVAGYTLTGDVGEQVLFIAYGSGANGKTTFLNALQDVLGSGYAGVAAPDLLLKKQHGAGHPTEFADLFGLRLAVSSDEATDQSMWDVRALKQLTGGDNIKARRMREDLWQFVPTHKFWLAANDLPRVGRGGEAVWRRIVLVPFQVTIPGPDRDPDLRRKLMGERSGILAWLVRGCLEWQRRGMERPRAIRDVETDYRRKWDPLGAWLEGHTSLVPGARLRAGLLHTAYSEEFDPPVTTKAFTAELDDRGWPRDRDRHGSYWVDRALRAEPMGRGDGS